jgi:hypothetical protein
MQRGALLAALVAGDSRLQAVEHTLPEREAITALGARLSPDGDKGVLLTQLAASMEPAVDEGAVESPRARALLAPRVAREVGERWLAEAPRVRRGFRPSRALVRSVAHACGQSDARADDGADLGAGRMLLAAALRGAGEERRGELLAGISAGEAASLLALSAHDDETLPPSPALLAAATLAHGDARVEALGRVGRGAAGAGERAALPMVRAGRELAELALAERPEAG